MVVIPSAAATHVGQLAHDGRTVGVYAPGQLLEVGDDRLVPDVELTESRRRIDGDVRGSSDHGQREATFRLLLVVELVSQFRESAFGVRRLVARADDAIAQAEVLELKRRQQRIT
jgi:hypothetical protein